MPRRPPVPIEERVDRILDALMTKPLITSTELLQVVRGDKDDVARSRVEAANRQLIMPLATLQRGAVRATYWCLTEQGVAQWVQRRGGPRG